MQSIEDILKRNGRVELDKAWEVSYTRRAIIAFITYVTACLFLQVTGNESPFINALIPLGGYLFSTLSLPTVRGLWLARRQRKLLDTDL